MSRPRSGELAIYGATGDLAFKKIFPALQRMVKTGVLDATVIGVARGGSLEELQTRARESVERHGGGVDPEAFGKLMRLLRHVGGEHGEPETFDSLRRELGDAARPLHYLAIPQSLFEDGGSNRGASCDQQLDFNTAESSLVPQGLGTRRGVRTTAAAHACN